MIFTLRFMHIYMFAFSYLLSALTAFYDVCSNGMSNLDKIIILVFSRSHPAENR